MRPLYTDWDSIGDIVGRLNELRPLLESRASGLELFDEFIDHDEGGRALDVIVDFLLDPATPPATAEVLDHITHLHQKMKLDDDSVTRLRAKTSHTPS